MINYKYELNIFHSKNYDRYNLYKRYHSHGLEDIIHTNSKAKVKMYFDLCGLKIKKYQRSYGMMIVYLDF